RHRACHLERIINRVFRDNIDRSSYGIGTEQRRTTTAYHFHTFDHVYRNLFQPVHSRESADDRTAVNQDLRVTTFQPIHPYLWEPAILAIVLHPKTRLEVQRFSPSSRVHRLKQFSAHHVCDHRCRLSAHLVPVGRNHHFICRKTY